MAQIKVGVIGAGNAGDQVADYCKKELGISAIALNMSGNDLTSVSHAHKIVIGDEQGAGKDRTIAKRFIQQSMRSVATDPEIVKLIEECDIIFVPSSTGGGSGSGTAPVMTDILSRMYPTKKFILIGILPTIQETVVAQQNSIEYLKEVHMMSKNAKESNGIAPTYMLYDNGKFSEMSSNEAMVHVNKEIVKDIAVIRGEYQLPSQYNSIDQRDMKKITGTPDRLVVVRLENIREKEVDEKSVEDRISEAIRKSAHAELEIDNIVRRMGLIVSLNNKVIKSMDTTLPKIRSIVGEPIEAFEHIHVNLTDQEPSRVALIMSGMSMPDDRIEKMIQRVDEVKHQITKVKTSSVLDEATTADLNKIRQTSAVVDVAKQDLTSDEVKPTKDVDIDNIFSQYMNID